MIKDGIIEMANKASKEWLKEFPTPLETANQVPKRYLEIFAKLVAEKAIKDWIASHNEICALLRQAHDALALTSYPPQRTWVSLTDREIEELWTSLHDDFGNPPSATGYERAIEAKLKDKNTRGQE